MKDTVEMIITEIKKGRSIMLDINGDGKLILDELCDKAKAAGAIYFKGIEKSAYYKSEYTPPFKKFEELKKLILCVNAVKGLRKEFCGVVMLDISEWLGHENDDYFSILLKFLYDKKDFWKCIFVVNSADEWEKKKIFGTIIKILRCGIVTDSLYDLGITKKIINETVSRQNVKITPLGEAILCKLNKENRWSEQETENIVIDIICESTENIIDKSTVLNYFRSPTCIYKGFYNIRADKERSFNREQ